jgi:hypothetical protein
MTVIMGRWLRGGSAPSVGRALLESLGDGVVSLASARLAGVDDSVEVAGNHRTMLRGVAGMGNATAIPVILERLGGLRWNQGSLGTQTQSPDRTDFG